MGLSFEPLAPWHWLTTAVLVACCLVFVSRGLRPLAGRVLVRWAVLGLTLLTCLLLGIAAWNPVVAEGPNRGPSHLVVVIDASESVLRREGAWPQLRGDLAGFLEAQIEQLPAEERDLARADVLSFAGGFAFAERDVVLESLPGLIAGLDQGQLAAGDGSNLEAALDAARSRFTQLGCRGSILLVSDGNETRGQAELSAKASAGQGVAIDVLPLESGPPRLAMTAANLPSQVSAKAPTFVRGVMRDSAGQAGDGVKLEFGRNPGLVAANDAFGSGLEGTIPVAMDDWARLRQPIQFEGLGLQFVELTLSDNQGHLHRRRLFTQVARPPRILAIGGDYRWIEAIPRGDAEIVKLSAYELEASYPIADFDAVVISDVVAGSFREEALSQLASAVQNKGVGLFMINGDHEGRDDEKPTVVMSYKDGPLEELLPVHPGPRPYSPDPQPRQIVILVDTSGSMAGERLESAKSICRHIIGNLLRPQDNLDLLTFTTGAGFLVRNQKMDEKGIAQAMAKVDSMVPGGGTDPRQALQMISLRRMTDCGLIFISDGEFAEIAARPDCVATVFAIGKSSIPTNSPLRQLADPFAVDAHFDPSLIRIPYFEPEPRTKFYEREPFVALAIERFLRPEETLPMPGLSLPGSAVSYAAADAEVIAARPKLTDPILAYRNVGRGRTGVFMSSLSGAWLTEPSGRAAIERWIRDVLAYGERDRYAIKVVDTGETLELEIAVQSKGDHLAGVDQLQVSLDLEAGETQTILFKPDPLVPGSFRAFVRVARKAESQRGSLVIREVGAEATGRPQRIPIVIPREGLVSGSMKGEANSFGVNEGLLRAVADTGGGTYVTDAQTLLLHHPATGQKARSQRAPFLLAAFLCLLVAFGLRRWNP